MALALSIWHDSQIVDMSRHGAGDGIPSHMFTASCPHTVMEKLMYPRVQCRGLTPFARRNRACVFRKLIQVTLYWNLEFLQNILELRLSPEILTQIDWHLKIQNTTFLCIKIPPPILSPLHSTCGGSMIYMWISRVTCEWDMSHVNASWCTYELVMSHAGTSYTRSGKISMFSKGHRHTHTYRKFIIDT